MAIKASTGEVFVSNFTANTVSVFAPGATTASRTLTGVTMPTGLAFDNCRQPVGQFPPGQRVQVFEGASTTPTRSIPTVAGPAGIAVDPMWNYLYVTSPSTGTVAVHNAASGLPVPGLGLAGLQSPEDIAVQVPTGLIYVSEYTGARVSAYQRGSTTLDVANTLIDVNGPWGVAVSPLNGAVHVSDNPNRVRVFPPTLPVVSGVDPSSGPVTGGTVVAVNGSNLGAITAVTFNGVPAEQVGPVFPTTMPVKVPAATLAGPVTVQVKWAGNLSGKVDAFTYTPVAPGQATEVFGARGDRQVTVSWKAPAFTGGVPIASYLVTPSPSGAPCATSSTSCTIGGLTNGAPYTFTVTTTNTASLTSVSAASPAVTPVIAMSLKVKAKKASYRPGRWGTRTMVSWAKKSTKANRMVTRTCTNGTGLSSSKLCKFTVYKTGKVKVRTKGFKNVVVTISIVATPKSSAGPTYGPSRPGPARGTSSSRGRRLPGRVRRPCCTSATGE